VKYSSREAALNAIKTLNGAQTVLVSFLFSYIVVIFCRSYFALLRLVKSNSFFFLRVIENLLASISLTFSRKLRGRSLHSHKATAELHKQSFRSFAASNCLCQTVQLSTMQKPVSFTCEGESFPAIFIHLRLFECMTWKSSKTAFCSLLRSIRSLSLKNGYNPVAIQFRRGLFESAGREPAYSQNHSLSLCRMGSTRWLSGLRTPSGEANAKSESTVRLLRGRFLGPMRIASPKKSATARIEISPLLVCFFPRHGCSLGKNAFQSRSARLSTYYPALGEREAKSHKTDTDLSNGIISGK
jgi:hypothetical protein